MAKSYAQNLTRFQRDTLKEVASIGANAASTSLSKLTSKFILVELTNLKIVSLKDMPDYFPGKSNVGILFSVTGEMYGTMVNMATEKSMLLLCDLIKGVKPGTCKALNKDDKDMIKEVGNIVVGSYLAALSEMAKMNLLESVPKLLIDETGGIIRAAMDNLRGKPQEVMIIENRLTIDKKKFRQDLVLLLLPEDLDKLFEKLFKKLE